MRERFSNFVVVTCSLLFVALLAQLVTSCVWGRWFAVRRADVSYNVVSTGGRLVLQRAHLAYPPIQQGWSFARGACTSGEFGPEMPSSPFEDFGLVDTVIRIPWEVNGSTTAVSSISATGRSVSFHVWPLLLCTGYLPLKHLNYRLRSRRASKRRGFEVTVIAD